MPAFRRRFVCFLGAGIPHDACPCLGIASLGSAAWACLAVHGQRAACWGVVTDISGPRLDALFGLMYSLARPCAMTRNVFD